MEPLISTAAEITKAWKVRPEVLRTKLAYKGKFQNTSCPAQISCTASSTARTQEPACPLHPESQALFYLSIRIGRTGAKQKYQKQVFKARGLDSKLIFILARSLPLLKCLSANGEKKRKKKKRKGFVITMLECWNPSSYCWSSTERRELATCTQ